VARVLQKWREKKKEEQNKRKAGEQRLIPAMGTAKGMGEWGRAKTHIRKIFSRKWEGFGLFSRARKESERVGKIARENLRRFRKKGFKKR